MRRTNSDRIQKAPRTVSRRVLAAGAIVTAGVAGVKIAVPGVQAQDDEFTSPLELVNGTEISWETPWEPEAELTGTLVAADFSGVFLVSGDYLEGGVLFNIMVLEESDDPQRGLLDEIVAILPEGEDRTFSALEIAGSDNAFSTSSVEIAGEPRDYLQSILLDDGYLIVQRLWAPEGAMTPAFDDAQETVEVDDDPAMALVDRNFVLGLFGSGSSTEDDEATPGDEANDAYLDDVEEQYELWAGQLDEVSELFYASDLDEADTEDDVETIMTDFEDAPGVADDLDDAPSGYAEVQDAFESFADALAEIPPGYELLTNAEPGSADEDDAIEALTVAFDTARKWRGDVQIALDLAG